MHWNIQARVLNEPEVVLIHVERYSIRKLFQLLKMSSSNQYEDKQIAALYCKIVLHKALVEAC